MMRYCRYGFAMGTVQPKPEPKKEEGNTPTFGGKIEKLVVVKVEPPKDKNWTINVQLGSSITKVKVDPSKIGSEILKIVLDEFPALSRSRSYQLVYLESKSIIKSKIDVTANSVIDESKPLSSQCQSQDPEKVTLLLGDHLRSLSFKSEHWKLPLRTNMRPLLTFHPFLMANLSN